MTPELFHPIIARWFQNRFGEPTEPQRLGWPEILANRNTLITAPTGSGKTLAAFLVCIDRLLRQAIDGTLTDATQVVYVSPLKALSNDVRRNLEVPLREIRDVAAAEGVELPEIRVLVRTGDTPQSERQAMSRRPPHILVTTPESLYLVLTAAKGREILRTIRTVIVDEIHALARDKRGSHLTLSLERLAALCGKPPVRIGLSATVRPVDEIARFLVGKQNLKSQISNLKSDSDVPPCSIIDVGHVRELDLGIEVPPSELSAVCSIEQWAEIYARIIELIQAHRSTLIFVNTRRLSERVAHNLRQQLGDESVAAHHGSLSREIRLAAEERLKNGQLKAIVATASLELGIDIGFIDLVCQIGSPRSIATFLQRVGRSGHSLGRVPKGRLFPLTRDELIECMALVRAVRARRLDAVEIPIGPLDILAQQIVATVACDEWAEDELYELCRGAWPYRNLSRTDFDAVVEMVSEGFAGGRRRGAYLHRDRMNGRLRARRGARIAAATSGGAIPELGDYRVVTETDRTFVGSVNEDFAIESISGDVFILGNTSWRIAYVRGGEVVVNDARGQPATIPFWLGEAPGRTVELSAEVSRLREAIALQVKEDEGPRIENRGSDKNAARVAGVESSSPQPAIQAGGSPLVPRGSTPATPVAWLRDECGIEVWAAQQAVNYVAAQQAAIDVVPTQKRIVFERFFDESGGMQLVIHAPFGSRINRAWGLAMRKRFCRSFDFELQAAADDNGIVLALGPQHSFPIEQMFKMLRPDNGEHMLTQALMAVPLFPTRFRWNAARSLAILRFNGGKKVPFHLQRFRSDDLLTAVFPACTACLENRPEDLPIPDHPLVRQTIWDCLHEAMDVDRWVELLRDIEAGRVELVARDTREPSPFSHQLLNANPYAFLDGAPLEERRTRAVSMRRSFTVDSVRDLGRLDPDAIAQVRTEAWPLVRDADELHDTLLLMTALPATEGESWAKWFGELVASGRATEIRRTGNSNGQADPGSELWITAERWPLVRAAFPDAEPNPPISLPESLDTRPEASQAWVALVRGRLECVGPVTASKIARDLGLPMSSVQAALEALEGEGFVLRGQFEDGSRQLAVGSSAESESPLLPTANSPLPSESQWCERRLLARIHRLTLDGLRRQIQPVEVADFIRFLLEHHHLTAVTRLTGRRALVDVIEQLQGCEIPAGAWEHEILSARLAEYDPAWLDELSLSGHVAWGRLQPPRRGDDAPARALLTRVVPIALGFREDMNWLVPPARSAFEPGSGSVLGLDVKLRSSAQAVYDELVKRGALFAHDLQSATELLPSQLEEALRELAAVGLVTADGFAAIRSIASRDGRNGGVKRRLARWGRLTTRANSTGGRWSLFVRSDSSASGEERAERWAALLLQRYGVVFRDLLARESAAPPWRELARVYRRLEARGEIRGGRFVAGVAGEQFGTSEAVDRLRKVRDDKLAAQKTSHAGVPEDLARFRPSRPFGPSKENESGDESSNSTEWLVISACDPLNLIGIITPGPRVPAMRGNRLLLNQGRLIASIQGGKVLFHEDIESAEKDEWVRWMKLSGLARMRHETVTAAGEPARSRPASKEFAR
jgi:ATP-dependent Lhr-like helicase